MKKKKQELNEKEQELQNNTREINDLKLQNKLLKERSDYEEKSSKLKIKENNELRNEIEKLKEVKIQKSNIIDKASSTFPKILQDVRKRDDKARTFAPPDNNNKFDEIDDLAESTSSLIKLTKLKKLKNLEKNITDEYKSINLNDVDDLIDKIGNNITIGDNIVHLGNNEYIYFKDLLDFLSDIKNNKINNFNKKEEYEKKIINTENKLINRKIKSSANINLYIKYLNDLKNLLFSDKKSSGKGLNITALPILLSKLNIINSRELTNNIKYLLNHLYNTKQITKQLYNSLIKAITYKNDS